VLKRKKLLTGCEKDGIINLILKSLIKRKTEEKDVLWAEKESILEELPPYDWGEEGIPEGKPIEYDPDFGFIVVEEES